MSTFVLNVQDIDEAGKDYSFTVSHAWLRHVLADAEVRPDEAQPEGHLEIRAHRQGNDMVLHGHLRSALVTDCARCLTDARIAVDVQVSLLLSARGRAGHRALPVEQELTPEDLDRDTYSGDKIDLDPVVREHLLLEVPIKPLCQDACPGIAVPASVAGPRDLSETEGGVDPRLAPLMKLVGAKPTEE